MPIVDIQFVVPAGTVAAPGLAQGLADAVGGCLSASPGHVWLRLELLSADRYAENQARLDADALPVFVRILHRQPPVGVLRQTEVSRLTQAVALLLRRPETQVHVEYAAPGGGRMAFGGKLVD